MEGLCEKQLSLRSSLYELIASCLYAEPSQDTLRDLARHKPYLEDLLTHWHEAKLQESVFRFLRAAEQSNANDLAIDYTRLFLGGSPGSPCPSESSYVENRLFGKSTSDVKTFYARCGFATDESFTEPDDHIAVECYFMSLLARSSLAAWHTEENEISSFRNHIHFQISFLEEHLSRWIEAWAMDVKKFSTSGFFRAVANLAVVTVISDLDFLTALTRTENSLS
jgi:putative dimethyl sulfoxide reductase chaperone